MSQVYCIISACMYVYVYYDIVIAMTKYGIRVVMRLLER